MGVPRCTASDGAATFSNCLSPAAPPVRLTATNGRNSPCRKTRVGLPSSLCCALALELEFGFF